MHQYREKVWQHNFFLPRVLVEAMEAEPLPPWISASVAQMLHAKEFREYHLPGAIPESTKSLPDLVRFTHRRFTRRDNPKRSPGRKRSRSGQSETERGLLRLCQNVHCREERRGGRVPSGRSGVPLYTRQRVSLVRDCRIRITANRNNSILYIRLKIKS